MEKSEKQYAERIVQLEQELNETSKIASEEHEKVIVLQGIMEILMNSSIFFRIFRWNNTIKKIRAMEKESLSQKKS